MEKTIQLLEQIRKFVAADEDGDAVHACDFGIDVGDIDAAIADCQQKQEN